MKTTLPNRPFICAEEKEDSSLVRLQSKETRQEDH